MLPEHWYLWFYVLVLALVWVMGVFNYGFNVCHKARSRKSNWEVFRYAICTLEKPPDRLCLTYSGLLGMFAVLALTTTVFPCDKCWTWVNVNALVQLVTLLMTWGMMAQSIRGYELVTPDFHPDASYYAVLLSSLHSAAAIATATVVLAGVTGTDIWQLTENVDFWHYRVLTVLVVYVVYRGVFSRLNLLLVQLLTTSQGHEDDNSLADTLTLLICAIFPPVAALLLLSKELYSAAMALKNNNHDHRRAPLHIVAYNVFLQITVSFFNHGIPPIGVDYGGDVTVGSGGSALSKVGLKATHGNVSAELTSESEWIVIAFFVLVFLPGAAEVVSTKL